MAGITPEQDELLLACPECRRVVAVHYHVGFRMNRIDKSVDPLDEHRTCYRCGNDMVETERNELGQIICPEPVLDGSVTRTVVKAKSDAAS